MRSSCVIGLFCACVLMATSGLRGDENSSANTKADTKESAAKVAESWWYKRADNKQGDQSAQSLGAGPTSGDFFAMTGTVINGGSYEDAWKFYAKKCHADLEYSDRPQILGRPTTNGYVVVFQRTDNGTRNTTFGLHQHDVTVSVSQVRIQNVACSLCGRSVARRQGDDFRSRE